MPFKSVFERNPLCILHKRHRLENWESSNGLFDRLKQIVPPIWRMSLTTFITKGSIEYTSPWAEFELTTLVVIGTDCICAFSCKFNYHAIKTTAAPNLLTWNNASHRINGNIISHTIKWILVWRQDMLFDFMLLPLNG